MLCARRRTAASLPPRARIVRCALFLIRLSALLPALAHAVIVRGHATDSLGQPVSGARVQLIQGTQVIATALSDEHGFFEARTGNTGRFKMLSTAPSCIRSTTARGPSRAWR